MSSDFKTFQQNQINQFLDTLFLPSDTICFVVIRDGKTTHRFKTRQDVSDSFIAWLAHENANGGNVYVSVNKLKPNARDRKQESFLEEQQVLYLDLDSKHQTASSLIQKAKGILGEPSMLVRSSRGNYQGYWLLEQPLPFVRLQKVMKACNDILNIDHTQDIARIFRLPGFWNKKPYKERQLCYISSVTNRRMFIAEFEAIEKHLECFEVENENKSPRRVQMHSENQIVPSADDACPEHEYFLSQIGTKYISQSEADMAFAIYALSHGWDIQDVRQELVRTTDSQKHDVGDYILRTLINAQNYLNLKKLEPILKGGMTYEP